MQFLKEAAMLLGLYVWTMMVVGADMVTHDIFQILASINYMCLYLIWPLEGGLVQFKEPPKIGCVNTILANLREAYYNNKTITQNN